jgi:hypothetical protein
MPANYSPASPYYGTQSWGPYLDTWAGKYIPHDVTDVIYQIDPPYNHRPDLLAQDFYQNPQLWWVFAIRNPDVIKDPIFDFVAPTIIYIPAKDVLIRALGL